MAKKSDVIESPGFEVPVDSKGRSRGPWCPQCQYEFRDEDGKMTHPPDKQINCPGCGTTVISVIGLKPDGWDSDKQIVKDEDIKEQDVPSGVNPEFARERTGKVVVRSQLWRLDSELKKDLDIEIEPFVTANVTVSRSFELTLKGSDGYPFAKVSVFISWPCYREEFEMAIAAVSRRGRFEIREEVANIMTKKKQQEGGSSVPATRGRGRREAM